MSTTTVTDSKLRLRKRRRFSTTDTDYDPRLSLCQRLPHSLEALDLSTASARESLGALRIILLSYLEDLETRLSKLESPISSDLADALKIKGEHSADEARTWARDALEMLRSIRSDVCAHFPEMPDVPSFHHVRSHFSSISLSDITPTIDDVRSRFPDLDFQHTVTALSARLQSLQAHLRSMDVLPTDIPSSFSGSTRLSGIYESFMSSELVTELADDVHEAEDMIEQAARDIARAVKQSLQGSKLIQYVDLPPQWRNNPFVTRGYRFIPLEKWPLIVMSLFAMHNETLNIHTHLIPFILWFINCIPFFNPSTSIDTPEAAFLAFALICLFSSVLWHTMAGCAHPEGMELCARIDYVGIGWLISASVGTVVYYGFQCHPNVGKLFLTGCFLTGAAGNVFPFFRWFNDRAYRPWRIAFFLSMVFTSAAPLAALAYYHSTWQVIVFVNPVWPSLISYFIGLIFYVTHIPERFLSDRYSHWLDWCGGGSHAIWHVFIVLAISQHRTAIASLRNGIQCSSVM